jgi:glycogen(starch) synthase
MDGTLGKNSASSLAEVGNQQEAIEDMKILIITHEFPPYFFGGHGTYALDLSSALVAKGVDVVVVCGRSHAPIWETKGKLAVLRVNFPELPPRNLWFALANSDQTCRLARKVDVVHVQPTSSSFLIRKIIRDSGRRVVATVDGSYTEMMHCISHLPISQTPLSEYTFGILEAPLRTYMRDLDITKSSHLAVQAAHVKHEIVARHGTHLDSRISIIPSAIDFNELEPFLHLSEEPSNTRQIVFVGRLYTSKGVLFAVQAMKSIVHEMGINNIVLSIIGTGPGAALLERFVRKNHLDQFVRLLGQLPRRAVLRTMANANALVLPSLYEACPRVLLEAKALGLPTVLFSLPWTREFAGLGIHSETARPYDHVDLARKIVAASDTKKAEGGALKELRAFDMNEVAARLIGLYSSVRDSV